MSTPSIVDPFHRKLYARLSDDIAHRAQQLVSGSAATIQGTTATVAENYAAQTSYIKALTDVLDICRELELDQYGKRPGEGEQE